jgi:6-phosphogluconolactonase
LRRFALTFDDVAQHTIKIVHDIDAMAHEALRRIVAAAERAIDERGRFSIALSGGSTPRPLYELMARGVPWEPPVWPFDWANVHFYFADERCVPPDHPDSNYGMIDRVLFDKLPVNPNNIHRLRGELDPNEAARQYGLTLKSVFGDGGLDMILLGMGEDGHTASLFPHTAALNETEHRVVANHVPALDAWRLTLSAPFINKAHDVIVMVSGAQKAGRLREAMEGPRDPQRLPIQLIDPASGRLTWLIDAAAAQIAEAP